MSQAEHFSREEARIWVPITLAVVLPCLLVLNTPPTPETFTQLGSLALWGWVVSALARSMRPPIAHVAQITAVWPLLAVFILLMTRSAMSSLLGSEPVGMTLAALLLLGSATLTLLSGSRTASSASMPSALRGLFIACLVLGAFNIAISFVQFFYPSWATDLLVGRSANGRAIGNVRQPNHLATLLMWSAIAVVPLVEVGWLRRALAVPMFVLLVASLMLTASRTGALELTILVGWGLLDRRLSRPTRTMLLSAPLVYGASWVLTQWWAAYAGIAFAPLERLNQPDESGTARLLVWKDALALIRSDPWTGVGFGNFNFAQTLTPSEQRSVELAANAHNLLLHLATELGLPTAAAIAALALLALQRAWARANIPSDDFGVGRRAAFVLLLPVALHSQVEYPLWSAYFLLPTAWIWGLCLGMPVLKTAATGRIATRRWPHVMAGSLVSAAALIGCADYLKVVGMYEQGPDAPPLIGRIIYGRNSYFFGYHGDYSAATVASEPWLLDGGFERALHYRLDPWLMMAWARTLHEQGDEDRARYIAARLNELGRPESKSFFSVCAEPRSNPPPFQCEAPTRPLTWHSFAASAGRE